MSPAPVVILACGNPSRGDDALGPILLDRLQAWLESAGCAGLADDFELIGDFQLQVEHALDLIGRRLALFIDAGQQTPAPFVFRRAQAIETRRDIRSDDGHFFGRRSCGSFFLFAAARQ